MLPAHPLPVGVLGNQDAQFGYNCRMLTCVKIELDGLLDRVQPQMFESGRGPRNGRHVQQAVVGCSAPQAERVTQARPRGRRITAGRRLSGLGDQPLEHN